MFRDLKCGCWTGRLGLGTRLSVVVSRGNLCCRFFENFKAPPFPVQLGCCREMSKDDG